MSEESMKDLGNALEESYKMMGDGEHDTDALAAWEHIKEMYESKESLTVTVNSVVKGGVTCDVEGVRGFIPASALSLSYVEDLNTFMDKELTVRVITADMENDKLVLSAKEILKEQRDDARKQAMAAVKVGAVLKGKVESLKDYGAFVRLDGDLSGLVHVSQISHQRIKSPEDVLKVGQEVDVKVIAIKDGKISLSMKALTEDTSVVEENVEPDFELPKSEAIGTSMADLLKAFM